MSTDRQRVKRAIQRIAVQAPELQSFLDDAESKGGKAKSAGVGSSSEAQGDRVCCDGSVGGANPGTGERDPDADGAGQDGLNGDDPADINMGDGTLSGVVDCATGQPICFDGAGFIPPDGWDEPSDAPVLEWWDDGYYKTHRLSAGFPLRMGLTCCDAVEKSYEEDSSATLISCTHLSSLDVEIVYESSNTPPGGVTTTRECNLGDCSSQFIEEYCDLDEPPTESAWPSDGCTNLIVKGGKIVGSKYDPENDGSYSAPRDSIDLCSGGDQISLAPAANGGWKTINSTTGNGYLYDSSGRQIAHIDGNEYSDPSI